MIKKTIILSSLSIACFSQAQDISVVTNTVDVYSNPVMKGNARFDAMVGSNGALGGDATALQSNPAGLGVAITSEVTAALQVSNYENKSTLGSTVSSYKNDMTQFSNVGGVAAMPVRGSGDWKYVNFGVNYSNRSLDNYVGTNGNQNITFSKSLIDTNNNPVTGTLAFEKHAYNRTGDQSKLSLGIGANYDHTLYFGAGLNFTSSTLNQYDTAALSLDLNNTMYEFHKQYTPYSEEANGFSASIGMIGKLSKNLRFGLALETPTWWSMDRVYTNFSTNSNGAIVTESYSEDRALRSPFKTTLSAALVPNKNLAINVDYTVGLSKSKYKEQGAAEKEINEFFSNKTKNTSELKIGAEYRVKRFRVRGGYAYANSPFESITMNTVNTSGKLDQPFMSERKTLGLGIGYQFNSFSIDAAYQNVRYSTYQNSFMQGFESYGSGYYSGDFDVSSPKAIVSDVDKKQSNVTISVGWKF